MESLIHADIFFVITAVAVVILAALVAVALVYAIRILRDLKKVTNDVKDQSKLWMSDADEMRRFLKREGLRAASVAGALGRLVGLKRKPKKKADETEADKNDY